MSSLASLWTASDDNRDSNNKSSTSAVFSNADDAILSTERSSFILSIFNNNESDLSHKLRFNTNIIFNNSDIFFESILEADFNSNLSILDKDFVEKLKKLTKFSKYRESKIELLYNQRADLQQIHNRVSAKLQEITSKIQIVDFKFANNSQKISQNWIKEFIFINIIKRKMQFTFDWLDKKKRKKKKIRLRRYACTNSILGSYCVSWFQLLSLIYSILTLRVLSIYLRLSSWKSI